ncbi:KICSTOR complex protein SZT2-like isoform X2 [Acanthaster planci]|uniref:KICSTOR complex protein SZT2-like isoform X2 n=1 Tax=Acanthaster planci TaxID=133434 RepID=A0A8B7Z5H2_ACAPL|nr:KICSTOR complex protein SZT2-like isoform X2 [Acanthaster planci]
MAQETRDKGFIELEVGEVYLLMKEEYRISRNIRASWFFGNLNKEIKVKSDQDLINSKEELEVLSIIPRVSPDKLPADVPIRYKLVPSSHVTFLARRYRHVIVMDLSPSMATVDAQSGRVSLQDLFRCISNCLQGLVKPFSVPGSSLLLSPKIYVTVIAYTPLASLTTQQVLFQGCLLTQDNLSSFLDQLQEELEEFENKLVDNMFASQVNGNPNTTFDLDHPNIFDDIVEPGGLSSSSASQRPETEAQEMASPEACFVNMLWCGILALQLLPENTSAGIICVTDGVTAMPDMASTTHLLTQMRNSTVACSFLQVGKGFHPHCSFGYIPHTEIMQFIATATFGAFLSKCPKINSNKIGMNQYHKAFLSWNFQKGLDGIKIDYIKGRQHQVISSEVACQTEGIQLPAPFAVNKQGLCTIPLIRKKHRDYKLHTSLANVLSVRLREGYTIKDVALTKNDKQIEVKLALPWKYNGRIEYIASSAWPLNPNRHLTNVDVIMEGSYEFLHDLTCRMKKSPHNAYRTRVVMNFWQTLRSLQETDQLLVHLQSFSTNSIYYTVPDGIKKGIPLLYMPPYSETPVLAQKFDSKDSSLEQFAGFWKRISLMEPKKWQRWLHTHRIALLLVPDMPLPKHLFLPNSNGRYNNIQSRVAQKELNSLLTEFSTFTLLENHSYITLTSTDGSSSPTSFYLIRVQSKAPCVVIRLAFLGGTSGHERNKIVSELRHKLQDLTVPTRQTGYLKASTSQRKSAVSKIAAAAKGKPAQQEQKQTTDKSCVVILARPIDIILVKYERMPPDFTDLKTSIRVTTGSVPVYMDSKGPIKDLNRLACYLHHHRWIWDAQNDHSPPISTEAVAHVLSVLTDLRLQEGFHFSYSNSGIISFVTELKMKNPMKSGSQDLFPAFTQAQTPAGSKPTADQVDMDLDTVADGATDTVTDEAGDDVFPCLVQYIVFPPHTATYCMDRTTGGSNHPDLEPLDDQDTAEADGRLQLVTECWVEPQSGMACDVPSERDHFQNCSYKDVPQVLFPLDQEVISTLLTFEHLKILCHDQGILAPVPHPSTDTIGETLRLSESITHLPYSLELLKLLPKCQQAEVLCSTYIEEPLSKNSPDDSFPRPHFPRYPKPNNTLYCLLLTALSKMTGHELTLSEEDGLKFVNMVLNRSRDGNSNPAPFELPDSDFEALMKRAVLRPKSDPGRTTSLATELSDSLSSTQPEAWQQALKEGQALRESPVPRWTCFVKDAVRASDADKDVKPSSHLLLTFVPASYGDLQKLMELGKVKDQDGNQDSSGKLDASAKVMDSRSSSTIPPQETTPASDGLTMSEEQDLTSGACVDDSQYSEDQPDSRMSPDPSDVKHGLTLPIYVYDCSLSSLRHQLLKTEDHEVPTDVFQDLTFASLEAQIPAFVGSQTSSRSGSGTPRASLSRHSSRGHLEQVAGAPADRSLSRGQPSKTLGRFCTQLGEKISKYFVMGIFKGLQRGQYVDAQDVQMALDFICVESLHDIDITHFLHAVCGHIRKYSEKLNIEQQASDLLTKKIKFADQVQVDIDEDDNDAEETTTRSHAKTKSLPRPSKPSLSKASRQSVKIPLSALRSARPCPTGTNDLHKLIQRTFTQVMGNHFQPVPSNPDIWFFRQPEFQEMDLIFQEADDDGRSDCEILSVEPEKLHTTSIPEEITSEQMSVTSYTSENEEIPVPENKINSIVDVYQSSLRQGKKNSLGETADEQSTSTESLMGSYEEEMSPLFVHLVCSVKLKNNVGNMSKRTLPTCLGHLIDCLESPPEEEIDPADLSVTLDLICLTLPSELDEAQADTDEVFADRRREVSTTESTPPQSPQPQCNSPSLLSLGRGRELSEFDEEVDSHGLDSEGLGSLPEPQIMAIKKTKEEIKWLLEDEIASAKHHIFPVTVETLDMVAQHVRVSYPSKPSCKAAEIPLQFVFGPEQSLAQFTEELERTDIPGCELCKVGHYYHLMYDQTHIDNTMRNQAIQSALENLGEQEPHRLVGGETPTPTAGEQRTVGRNFQTTTIICTPPSPCKAISEPFEGTGVEGQKDGVGNFIETADRGAEAEKLKEAARDEDRMRDGEDNASGSSDSSIQVLADEHDGDVLGHQSAVAVTQSEGLLHDSRVVVESASQPDPSEEPGGAKIQASGEVEEGEDGSSLQRNSTSFIVLSQVGGSQSEPLQLAEMSYSDTDVTGANREHLTVGDHRDSRSHSSTSSTSTVTLTHKLDSGMLLGEDDASLSAPEERDRPLTGSDSAGTGDHPPSATLQQDSAMPNPPQRTSSQSSESDVVPLVGRKPLMLMSAASSGPPSSQISYTGSLNDNDEEGYEGGSSDLELDDAQELSSEWSRRRQLMPDFWLILRIHTDRVEIFYHSRDHDDFNNGVGEQLYGQVTDTIRNTCRTVNQRLLLQDLYKTHSCKSILFGESDEDAWQSEDPIHFRIGKPSLDDDEDDIDQAQKDYLVAAMEFNPGHFACDLMWNTHLSIHARLYTGHRGGSSSPGMQALISALSAFAVSNRRNMFVFRETSGGVFYLRLFDSTIVSYSTNISRVNSAADTGHHYEPGSQPVSRATSVQSLNTLGMGSVFEEELSSTQSHMSDSRKVSTTDSGLDSMSTLSRATGPGRTEHTIRLDVHGVDPPGPEIREDLVELLRNRLAEATLDVISVMLDRNPMCKLTPHDIQFVQPLTKPPTETLHFTIPQTARPHLFSLAFYLGQNLRQFLHLPKYSSPRAEDHFQDYVSSSGGGGEREKGIELPENEAYLYNRPERAGRTGIGIACISMGLVDGRGNPVSLHSCPRPSPVAHMELQDTLDFVSWTRTERYYMGPESQRKPGPTALIQFAIWQRGNIDLPHLTNRLKRAVQHSLCDVVMEYCVLTAPMGTLPQLRQLSLTPFSSPAKVGETEAGGAQPDVTPSKGVRQLFKDCSEDKVKDVERSSPVSVKRSLSMGETPMYFASDIRQFMRRMQKRVSPGPAPESPFTSFFSFWSSHQRSQSVSSSITNSDGMSRVKKQRSLEQKEEKSCSSGSQPSTPVKIKAKDPSPKTKESGHMTRDMPGWQAQELERRQDEALRQRQRDAEEGKVGMLHTFFRDVGFTWMDYEHSLDVPTIHKVTEELSSRFSLGPVVNELLTKLPSICADLTTKVYRDDGTHYQLWATADPKESKSQEKLTKDQTPLAKASFKKLLPGKSENYVLIGRNIRQWRYSLDNPSPEDLVDVPSLVNPSSHKSYQRFKPLDLNSYSSSEKLSERDLNPLTSLMGRSQGLHLVPRQRLLLMQVIDKKITLFVYNWSSELMDSLKTMLHRLVMWHNSRSHLLDCLVSQKMGLFNHTYFGKNKLKGNPFCRSLEEIESLVKYTVPPQREFLSRMPVTAPKSARRLHRSLPPFDETLRNAKVRRPLHRSNYGVAKDPVVRQGAHMLEGCVVAKKETEMLKKLENLYLTWQKRGTQTTQPVARETLDLLKLSSRIVHYCATPLLFSTLWRHLVMGVGSDDAGQSAPSPPVGGTAAEEAWHMDLRSSFLQQYVQCLQKLGLTPVETKVSSPRQMIKTVRHKEPIRSQSPVHRKSSTTASASQHLQVTSAGGIILIELSFQHAYFCVKIFAFESSRVPAGEDINQQLAKLFTDDCDQYKDLIHIHSFAHDFHLRTVQAYFHRPQMGFKSRYHVTSFLADFVKFYTPRPKFCRNHVHEERQGFLSHNTPAPLLYQYLMEHHPTNMKRLSMAKPPIALCPNPQEGTAESEEEEYAIVSHQFRVLKDNKGNRAVDEFDCSLVICWNKSEYQSQTRPNSPTPTTPDPAGTGMMTHEAAPAADASPNLLNLCFYVIVTSKRELYPIHQGWARKSSRYSLTELDNPPCENTHSYMILKEEVQRAKERIIHTVRQAANNCRRDTLWSQLLQGETIEEGGAAASTSGRKTKKKEGEEQRDPNILRMTYPEFKVLLDTVHQVPLTQIDEKLVPLLSNGITWYDGLLRFLRAKFSMMTRFFTSEDRLVSHLALVNPNHTDMMVLLTVDKQANMSELVALYREDPKEPAEAGVSSSQQVMATHRQVEIVVNAVAYYMWTMIT